MAAHDLIPKNFKVRRLEASDFDKGYLALLSGLTTVGPVTQEAFLQALRETQQFPSTYFHFVIEEVSSGKLAAAGTLFLERKFIRGCGKVGHIEDIVVSPEFRKVGLGKALIQFLLGIGKAEHCYKVILDCEENNKPFYLKNGFVHKGLYMAHYTTSASPKL